MATFDDMEPEHKLRVYDKGIDQSAEPYERLRRPLGRHLVAARAGRRAAAAGVRALRRRASARAATPISDARNGLAVVRVLAGLQASLDESRRTAGPPEIRGRRGHQLGPRGCERTLDCRAHMTTPSSPSSSPPTTRRATIEDVLRRVRRSAAPSSSSSTTARPTTPPRSSSGSRASCPSVRVIRQPATRARARPSASASPQSRGDFVVIQDADLEYDPRTSRLLGPLLEGLADVVYGTRLRGGEPQRAHLFWHYAGNRFLSLLTNVLFNTTISDMEVGYKAFRGDLSARSRLVSDDFRFEPEVTAKILRARHPALRGPDRLLRPHVRRGQEDHLARRLLAGRAAALPPAR